MANNYSKRKPGAQGGAWCWRWPHVALTLFSLIAGCAVTVTNERRAAYTPTAANMDLARAQSAIKRLVVNQTVTEASEYEVKQYSLGGLQGASHFPSMYKVNDVRMRADGVGLLMTKGRFVQDSSNPRMEYDAPANIHICYLSQLGVPTVYEFTSQAGEFRGISYVVPFCDLAFNYRTLRDAKDLADALMTLEKYGPH